MPEGVDHSTACGGLTKELSIGLLPEGRAYCQPISLPEFLEVE